MSDRPTFIPGNLQVEESVYCQAIAPSTACITNAMVSAGTPIAAAKLKHEIVVTYYQADGTDVAATSFIPLVTINGIGCELISADVVCVDAPEGGDKKFTVDVLKCNQGSPTPASMLYEPIDYDNTKADAEVATGIIPTADVAANDTVGVQVAVSGSTGNQGQGFVLTLTFHKQAAS